MRHALAYLFALLASTVYVCATPTIKDESRCSALGTISSFVQNKINLWGEHAVKDAEKAVSDTFHTVSSAVENSELVKEIAEFTNAVQAMAKSVSEMHNIANSRGAITIDLDHVSSALSLKVDEIIQQLVTEFSEPHPEDKSERYKMVEQAVVLALDKVEHAVVTIYVGLGIPESEAREMFAHVQPHIKHVVLVLYKLTEEHPLIVVTVVATVITIILPEGFFLRPIMQIFGWGTKGPVKGSAAAWMQRAFFPASIPKGSWFSQLQKVGMGLAKL
ncbi:hypothetical protein D9619_001871 [Psilocybe cf. subviscida]|uniref:Uncharacterized protein n=1 Tax=Psilocybe cf. subviscida TaxID=2480587 RepID=A0A8H5BDW7_9AGAR|nr:hypothetical protein D9619_001871 [Psilocybe cf. subviscida]